MIGDGFYQQRGGRAKGVRSIAIPRQMQELGGQGAKASRKVKASGKLPQAAGTPPGSELLAARPLSPSAGEGGEDDSEEIQPQ